jgi:hypothetical protein
MKRKYDFTWDRLECYGTREHIEMILDLQDQLNKLKKQLKNVKKLQKHIEKMDPSDKIQLMDLLGKENI